ncbi:hypothetical protein BXZ70DRAFT_955773 [Cristinia sonorae]|uniref:Uncharacterized protein n=1 Tax=Cristinia sonorae TaxID=1940300 RepID=A0A8K0UG10_9AGAR|nr:hypothetical protein BXZ70DRAFT_955773 [Cristinia sonorae]
MPPRPPPPIMPHDLALDIVPTPYTHRDDMFEHIRSAVHFARCRAHDESALYVYVQCVLESFCCSASMPFDQRPRYRLACCAQKRIRVEEADKDTSRVPDFSTWFFPVPSRTQFGSQFSSNMAPKDIINQTIEVKPAPLPHHPTWACLPDVRRGHSIDTQDMDNIYSAFFPHVTQTLVQLNHSYRHSDDSKELYAILIVGLWFAVFKSDVSSDRLPDPSDPRDSSADPPRRHTILAAVDSRQKALEAVEHLCHIPPQPIFGSAEIDGFNPHFIQALIDSTSRHSDLSGTKIKPHEYFRWVCDHATMKPWNVANVDAFTSNVQNQSLADDAR